MFLNSKLKKTVKVFWWMMSAIIIVSMVLLYTPLPFLNSHSAPAPTPQEFTPPTNEVVIESESVQEQEFSLDLEA